MAKDFFKDLPDTSTPLTAARINGLLNGEESMGSIVVEAITCKNVLGTNNYNDISWAMNNSASLIAEKENMMITTNNQLYSGIFGKLCSFATLDASKTYTISFTAKSNNNIKFQYGLTSSPLNTSLSEQEKRLSFKDTGNNLKNNNSIFYNVSAIASVITIEDILIEEGDVATDYVPYKEINNRQKYSTSEQVIGKWIDGKTLYQRTFVLTPNIAASITSTQISLNTANVKIAMLDPSASYFLDTQGSTGYMPFPNVNSNAAALCGGYPSVQNGNIQIQIRKGGSVAIYELILTIRYTKTTD